MDLVEACEAVFDGYHYRNTIDIDVSGARGMMAFAANALRLECPSIVPTICIDRDMPDKTVGTFVSTIKIITLRRYNECAYDKGIVVHELAHGVQCFNGVPYCEKQAITAQCQWLRSISAEPDAYRTVKITRDREFAQQMLAAFLACPTRDKDKSFTRAGSPETDCRESIRVQAVNGGSGT